MNLVIGSAAYNETVKAKFKKEAMALLRRVVKILKLVKGTYDLRYNAAGIAGIACSGDATLLLDSLQAVASGRERRGWHSLSKT